MLLINTALVTLLALVSRTFAVSPLIAQGANFINNVDQSRFQIIGVDYQPGGSSGFNPGSGIDPLSNGTICLRDATLMQRLGVNTIRVYNLDGTIDHTACASVFNAAGIYMILDVNGPLPNESLDRTQPWNSYNLDYITRIFQVVEAFMHFNNTLGFFGGNEVINQAATIQVPQYLRAVTRDLKDFIASQSPRPIPVGYSAADVREELIDTWNYLSCNLANATSSKIDFFGLNSYSWCGNSSFQQAQYDQLVTNFSETTIPVFFSEYGCNLVQPRVFTEVPVLYGPQMTGVFSGGLVYEYSNGINKFGLVSLNDNDTVSIIVDYDNLRAQYNFLDLTALKASNSTATALRPPTCAPSLMSSSSFDMDFDIPVRPAGVDALIQNGLNGTFPTAFSAITQTTPPETVYGTNGLALTGLKLNILATDQSNLPGNNTSGTAGTAGGSSSSSASPSSTSTHNAGSKSTQAPVGPLAMGALGLVMML